MRVLTCGDVDLDARVVHVTKAFDESTRETKPPKTRNGIRHVPIHPNLVPLLRRLVEGHTRPVFPAEQERPQGDTRNKAPDECSALSFEIQRVA
jgi:hypothetical protein